MSQPLNRNYRCKDVEVLTASSNIILTAQENLEAITAERPLWKDPFFPDLSKCIDAAFKKHLGVDNAADLRSKTTALLNIANPAGYDLSKFKINVSEDFKRNQPRLIEILKLLGYISFRDATTNGDQEAMIQLLYTYQTGMTNERTEFRNHRCRHQPCTH